jgi:hypothetical protein
MEYSPTILKDPLISFTFFFNFWRKIDFLKFHDSLIFLKLKNSLKVINLNVVKFQ